EKTDLIPEGGIRTDDERTHRYHYDSQHRLVHYTRTQYAEPLVESRYLYDPVYTPARKIHLYHCDHRGLPLALVSTEG
ncbi:RHS domain-containing protein, partial [Escherichia coli]|uniref:RHS domain-containing protein n=1 Tax=Escherichia coli TaxID=562 RepID=UPI00214961A5